MRPNPRVFASLLELLEAGRRATESDEATMPWTPYLTFSIIQMFPVVSAYS